LKRKKIFHISSASELIVVPPPQQQNASTKPAAPSLFLVCVWYCGSGCGCGLKKVVL